MFLCLVGSILVSSVWDDNEFENIHFNEVSLGSSTLLRILGYFRIEVPKITNFKDVENEMRTKSASASAAKSICATYDKLSIVRLFVETSSVNYRHAGSAQENTPWKVNS